MREKGGQRVKTEVFGKTTRKPRSLWARMRSEREGEKGSRRGNAHRKSRHGGEINWEKTLETGKEI